MGHHTNIVRLKAVAHALSNLNAKVVFVGGATISLYPDRQVFEVRPTDDIDVIIEILNYRDRAKLEERLRLIGFSHDIESGIICRYTIQGIIVDIMPTNDTSIGFANIWYPDGFEKAIDCALDENSEIMILSAPYFIATKLEAHKGRGKNDGRTSQDFEDIVYVLENRTSIWEELDAADKSVNNYLKTEFKILMSNPNIFEWIDVHVERGIPSATQLIIDKIKRFIA
ncbi:MAG: nucleotidyl transferase AbiEii/AbiGii toxin family protein [Ferruginibacter sp.]